MRILIGLDSKAIEEGVVEVNEIRYRLLCAMIEVVIAMKTYFSIVLFAVHNVLFLSWFVIAIKRI